MTDHTNERSPDEIERDIRATQAEMSRTVEQIEGELTGRNILNSLLDKADQSGVDTRYLIDAARRNPLALGMIAVGGLWLVSDADARPSALKMGIGKSSGEGREATRNQEGWHPEHRAYVDHMSRCERRADEDDLSYRRRRDHSRASYFMMEQGHDEDESAFRQRLDAATENLRQRRDKAGESALNLMRQSRERTRQAATGAKDFYFDSPLLGGLAAAFVGAIAGSALPATRAEENYVGSVGKRAIDAVGSKARQAGEEARHRKDDMIDRAEQSLGNSSQGNSHNEQQTAFPLS